MYLYCLMVAYLSESVHDYDFQTYMNSDALNALWFSNLGELDDLRGVMLWSRVFIMLFFWFGVFSVYIMFFDVCNDFHEGMYFNIHDFDYWHVFFVCLRRVFICSIAKWQHDLYQNTIFVIFVLSSIVLVSTSGIKHYRD